VNKRHICDQNILHEGTTTDLNTVFCTSSYNLAIQVCRSSLLSGRNVRWPHRMLRRMLPSGESRWVCRRDRQTDRRTNARPLHYVFC